MLIFARVAQRIAFVKIFMKTSATMEKALMSNIAKIVLGGIAIAVVLILIFLFAPLPNTYSGTGSANWVKVELTR